MSNKITAYKGFDSDLKCRGMQFAIGGTFEQPGKIESCKNGLHACKHPLSVFEFYPPTTSRYAEVICEGEICDKNSADTKIAAAKITVTVELSIGDLVRRAWDYVWSCATLEGERATGYQGAASATGYRGAASATGDQGAASATGYQGAASATGYQGAASATGYQGAASATGDLGAASADHRTAVAMACGVGGAARGVIGSIIFLTYRNPKTGENDHAWHGRVGEGGIKEGAYYRLNEEGLPVEVTL